MKTPAHRSRPAPALVFVVLVGIALEFGSVQELIVYWGREGSEPEHRYRNVRRNRGRTDARVGVCALATRP